MIKFVFFCKIILNSIKDVHEMNEYNQKKTRCIWKFFHPWILRRARSAAGALVGFIFILRQQRRARELHTTTPSYRNIQSGGEQH